MDKAIEKLLNYLCVEWGFCIDPESANTLKNSQHMEADEFADGTDWGGLGSGHTNYAILLMKDRELPAK